MIIWLNYAEALNRHTGKTLSPNSRDSAMPSLRLTGRIVVSKVGVGNEGVDRL